LCLQKYGEGLRLTQRSSSSSQEQTLCGLTGCLTNSAVDRLRSTPPPEGRTSLHAGYGSGGPAGQKKNKGESIGMSSLSSPEESRTATERLFHQKSNVVIASHLVIINSSRQCHQCHYPPPMTIQERATLPNNS